METKIASIYYSPLSATRIYGLRADLPAVPKGGDPVILTLKPLVQRAQEPSPDGKSKIVQEYLVKSHEQAADLVREWTREAIGQTDYCHPGVWVVRDRIPLLNADGTPQLSFPEKKALFRDATEEEKRQMFAEDEQAAKVAQDEWATYLIQKGDEWHASKDPQDARKISNLMRLTAKHYGKEREWVETLKDGELKTCQFCQKTIPSKAVKCQHCSEVVDYHAFAKMKGERDAVQQANRTPPAKTAA